MMKRTGRAEELVGALERFERLDMDLHAVVVRAERIARGKKSQVLGYRHVMAAMWLVGGRKKGTGSHASVTEVAEGP